MGRRLDSIIPPRYVQPFETGSVFERLVESFPLRDKGKKGEFRDLLIYALEEFRSRKEESIRAKSPKEDIADLAKLLSEARAEGPREGDGARWEGIDHFAGEVLEDNLPLVQRLKWAFRDSRVPFPKAPTGFVEHAGIISGLADEIAKEQGRGRPTDWAAKWFANQIYVFWKEFSKRAVGRIRGSREAPDGAFTTFLKDAGTLVEPRFKATQYARYAWEEGAGQEDREKKLKARRPSPRRVRKPAR